MMKKVAVFGFLAILAPALPAGAQNIPFSNDERSCTEYGTWAVQIIRRAAAAGCNVQESKEVLDPAFHRKWCNGQSLAVMSKAHLVHRTGVAFRCARQGVDVK